MTVTDLHALTGKLIEQGQGAADVAFDGSTIIENEDPSVCVHHVEAGEYRLIQGVDDSGPVGPEFPTLVLRGEFAKQP
jgi:hypothetical protein